MPGRAPTTPECQVPICHTSGLSSVPVSCGLTWPGSRGHCLLSCGSCEHRQWGTGSDCPPPPFLLPDPANLGEAFRPGKEDQAPVWLTLSLGLKVPDSAFRDDAETFSFSHVIWALTTHQSTTVSPSHGGAEVCGDPGTEPASRTQRVPWSLLGRRCSPRWERLRPGLRAPGPAAGCGPSCGL